MKNKYLCQSSNLFNLLLVSIVLVLSVNIQAHSKSSGPSSDVINDPISCNDSANDEGVTFVYVPGVPYSLELTTLSKKHGVALTNCDSLGVLSTSPKWKFKKTRKKPTTNADDIDAFLKKTLSLNPSPFQFILYDLNEGKLEHNDKVVLQSPHGRLVGLTKTGKLKASRKYFAENEVFTIVSTSKNKKIKKASDIALISHTGKYIKALSKGSFALKVSDNKAKSNDPEPNEIFGVKVLAKTKARLAKEIFSQRGKVTNFLKKLATIGYGAFTHKPMYEIFEGATNTVLPKACRYTVTEDKKEAEKVAIEEEPDDADKAGFDPSKMNFSQKSYKAAKKIEEGIGKGLKKVTSPKWMAKQMAVLMKKKACSDIKKERRKAYKKGHKSNSNSHGHKNDVMQLSFELDVPKSDLGVSAFFTLGDKSSDLPVWHTAIMAGDKALNDNLLSKAIPSLKDALGGIKVTKFVAIVSGGVGVININQMGGKLGELLADFQASTKVHGDFKNVPSGLIKLYPGVNVFGEIEGAKTGPLALLSEAAFPGSTKHDNPWKISGVMGKSVLKAIIGKSGKNNDASGADFKDKTNFALNVWIPSHTPFPFNIINNKKILHTEVKQARLSFDLSSSQSGGKTSKGIEVSVKSWANYWLLSDKKSFAIEAEGMLTLKNGGISGAIDGVYTVKSSEDPLNMIPGFSKLGVHMTKLRVGGAIDIEKGAKDAKLEVNLASEIKVGSQKLQSGFTLITEKKGKKILIKELRLSLGGESGDPIKFKNMGDLGKIPIAKEIILDQASIGLTPKPSGLPDFYITGGAELEKMGVGGKVAIMNTTPKGSSRPDLFVFLSTNDFNLGKMLPKGKEYDIPRGVLTLLKLPKTMLMLNTMKKDGDLETDDFPEPLQAMFEGMTSGEDALLPIRGSGITIMSALSFDKKDESLFMPMFKSMGLTKFGPDGPLLISGGISGLGSADLSINIAGQLPGFVLPAKIGGKVNPVAKLFQPKGVDFFIDIMGPGFGEPRIEVGIKGLMGISLPRMDDITKWEAQELQAKLNIKATILQEFGIQASAFKGGTWTDPLGLNKNIAIKDTALLIGLMYTVPGVIGVEVGMGGDIIFNIKDRDKKKVKLTYQGDVMIGGGLTPRPPFFSPTKFGLALGADRISADTAVRVADAVFDGILTGGLANGIIDGDPNNPLSPGLPKGALKDGINKLRQDLAKQSLPDLLHLDDIPIPSLELRPAKGENKVAFYIATPGATIPGREDTMKGLGFALTGAASIDLLGKKTKIGEMALKLSIADGLRAYGRVEKIKLGALTLGHPKGTEIDLKASVEETYFNLLGGIKLTPLLDDQTAISLRADGTSFYIKKEFKPFFGMELDIKTGVAVPPVFRVKAKIDNNINKVVEDTLLPAFGIPKALIKQVASVNPLVIEEFKLDADLGAFATGGGSGIKVDIKPRYFGEERPMIKARIAAIDWKHPEKILLGSQELQNQILASLIDYSIAHPEKALKLPSFDLKVIALKNAYLGGGKRDYDFDDYAKYVKVSNKEAKKIDAELKQVYTKASWKKLEKKPEQKVFILNADTTLLDIKQKVNLQLSPNDMRFNTAIKILGGLVETKIAAKTAIVNNKIVPPMNFHAEISSGINDFVTDEVMPKLGIPKKVIKGLKSATPILINKVAFNGELAAIVQGKKKLQVILDTVFFGDTKNMKKVTAQLPISNVKKPLDSLLAGPEMIKALSIALVEYLIEHPQQLPKINLGLIELEKSLLGGEDVIDFIKKGKTEKVFTIKGGLKLPTSNPKADMKFGKTKMTLSFTDSLLNGAVSAKFDSVGEMTSAGPKNINFDAKVNLKKLNKWFDSKVIGKLPSEIKKVMGGIKVVVDKAEIKGNFEKFFFKYQQADMKLWMTVSGKKIQKTIPVFAVGASIKNINKENLAMAGLVAQVSGIIIDQGMKKLIGISLGDVNKKAKEVSKKAIASVGKTFNKGKKAAKKALKKLKSFFGKKKKRHDAPHFGDIEDTVNIIHEGSGLCLQRKPKEQWLDFRKCDSKSELQKWSLASGEGKNKDWLRIQVFENRKCLDQRDGKRGKKNPHHLWYCHTITDVNNQSFKLEEKNKKSKWGNFPVYQIKAERQHKGGHGKGPDCISYQKGMRMFQDLCAYWAQTEMIIVNTYWGNFWKTIPHSKALDITATKGVNNVWIIGTNHKPYQFVANKWVKKGNVSLKNIDVGSNGDVWATTTNGEIWNRSIKTKKWQKFTAPINQYGTAVGARDIGVGGGRIWITSDEYVKDGNFQAYYYHKGWHKAAGSGLRVDVSSTGYAYIITANIGGTSKGKLYNALDSGKWALVKDAVAGIEVGLASSGGTAKIVGLDGQLHVYKNGNYKLAAPSVYTNRAINRVATVNDNTIYATDNKHSIYMGKRH